MGNNAELVSKWTDDLLVPVNSLLKFFDNSLLFGSWSLLLDLTVGSDSVLDDLVRFFDLLAAVCKSEASILAKTSSKAGLSNGKDVKLTFADKDGAVGTFSRLKVKAVAEVVMPGVRRPGVVK